MKISVDNLRDVISEVVVEVRNLRKKKPVARKQSPASLLKQITTALSTLGFKVSSREKNSGSYKAWMDPVSKARKPVQDERDFEDEYFRKQGDFIGMYTDAPAAARTSYDEPAAARPSPGRLAMKYKKALRAAGLDVSVSGGRHETVLRGKGFDVIVPSNSERSDIGAALFIQVFAGRNAGLEQSGFDTTDLGESTMRNSVNEAIGYGDPVSIHDAEGRTYTGSKSKLYTAMVKFGTTSGERSAILSSHGGIPASQSLISYLKGQKLIKKDGGPSDPSNRPPKPYDWDKEDRKRLRARRAAENKFQVAKKKFARNWRGYTFDQPDVAPEDAAPDAAESFFWEYPQWKDWCVAMSDTYHRMTKDGMKDAVADEVYEEMLKGAKDASRA